MPPAAQPTPPAKATRGENALLGAREAASGCKHRAGKAQPSTEARKPRESDGPSPLSPDGVHPGEEPGWSLRGGPHNAEPAACFLYLVCVGTSVSAYVLLAHGGSPRPSPPSLSWTVLALGDPRGQRPSRRQGPGRALTSVRSSVSSARLSGRRGRLRATPRRGSA